MSRLNVEFRTKCSKHILAQFFLAHLKSSFTLIVIKSTLKGDKDYIREFLKPFV